ncbi:thiamine-phosphate synthase family protein [Saccharolobus caldissimus]|uniref:Transcriptional regulator n=1 Tax=Saccharolobus caldissimus TaxID=1702097 RepID=A0AAQ4CP13_9CREN|nr:thiamine-phosphate synthase family protein [Saccharolobus caldissimus]BDB97544.1 transcriptional regulator [Saccharolobus caldissimus]
MLKSPLSLIDDIFIPSIRVLEAKRLREFHMSQTKIASLLGVSQPAVKQYLDEDENIYYRRLQNLGLTKEELDDFLEKLTQLLINGEPKQVMQYISVFFLSNLSRLKFCKFHKMMDTEIPTDCDICKGLYKENEEEMIELALYMLQNESVALLIPEVLSNIAFAKSNAKSIEDVIAIPGRITKIRGIPTPASKPMWGGSRHLAKVLLAVMAKYPSIRSVMNIKFDSNVEVSLKLLNYKYKKVGPQDNADDDKISQLISSVFEEGIDAIIHLGGNGVEPNTYVFGRDPLDVVKKIINIGVKYKETFSR